MIIARYLLKEVFGTLLAASALLLFILLTNQIVHYLNYAASGKFAAGILLTLIGFEIPYLLAFLLPLGLYLGIIWTLGKLFSNNELRVMQACGLSIARLWWIISLIIFFMMIFVLTLMIWINPWIAGQKNKVMLQSSATTMIDTLLPGRFQVSRDGKRVLYVEQISRSRKEASNVFMANQKELKQVKNQNPNNHWTIISASSGYQSYDPLNQDRFLYATDGYRYEGVPGHSDYQVVGFKKYAVRLPTIVPSKHQEEEEIPSSKLWQQYHQSRNASELQWRLAVGISVLVLGLMAIPLSQIQPRQGRFPQLLIAILIYTVYVNLLFIARNWIDQNILPTYLGLWVVHGFFFVMALLLLLKQMGWRLR